MNPILRVILTVVADTIIFFILTFIVVAATADESNGFWGISPTGVGLFVAIPASIMIAGPSGFILGLVATRIIHHMPYILALAAAMALVVGVVMAILSITEDPGENHSIFSVPLFAATAIAFLSNLLTLTLVKLVTAGRAVDAKS